MIEVKNIIKSFDGKTILHDVSAKFYSGKTNLIIGQSGSGKTVLMKCIVGLVRPEQGEILYDGRDFMKMTDTQIKQLRLENEPCGTVGACPFLHQPRESCRR